MDELEDDEWFGVDEVKTEEEYEEVQEDSLEAISDEMEEEVWGRLSILERDRKIRIDEFN